MKSKIVIFFCIILFYSCKKDICDCLEPKGKIEQFEISLDTLKSLSIYSQFDIYIKQDTINKAVVQCGKNLIDLISLTTKDSILTIKNGNICNFFRQTNEIPKIYFHLTNLEAIYLNGPIKVYSIDTLKYRNLLIRVYDDVAYLDLKIKNYILWLEYWTATGDAYISGETEFFDTFINGYAFIHAFDFKAKYSTVKLSLTGIYEVNITDNMNVYLNGIGNIYYKGNPTINIVEQKSSGKLIKSTK